MLTDVGVLDQSEWRRFAKYLGHSVVIPEKPRLKISITFFSKS